jgi:hypothetical protein
MLTVANSPLRLTMFIYRKIGLFLEDGGSNPSCGIVNSAIISASLGGRKIVGLEDKVRLVFKPFQVSQDKVRLVFKPFQVRHTCQVSIKINEDTNQVSLPCVKPLLCHSS